ncbi:hypothetical protein FXO38_15963 [Capsicum annuum]|nr:hypothetical protein FXO38_15963 [Capsicum annuum]
MNSGAGEHREGSSKCYAKGGQPKAFFMGRPGITSDAMKGIKENGKSKDSIAQVRIHAPSDPKGDANGQGLRIGHVGETPLNG